MVRCFGILGGKCESGAATFSPVFGPICARVGVTVRVIRVTLGLYARTLIPPGSKCFLARKQRTVRLLKALLPGTHNAN